MVEDFENWCFDASRQVGDTGIVESTYGYHVMYFSGFGTNYRMKLVEDEQRGQRLHRLAHRHYRERKL